MEVCPEPERIILQNSAAFGNDSLDIGQRGETQMIRHMRHGSPPRLMAHQPIDGRALRESHTTPSAGNRMRPMGTGALAILIIGFVMGYVAHWAIHDGR